ncbi:MAG: hypothetical protein ACE5HR_00350 [bacterium]
MDRKKLLADYNEALIEEANSKVVLIKAKDELDKIWANLYIEYSSVPEGARKPTEKALDAHITVHPDHQQATKAYQESYLKSRLAIATAKHLEAVIALEIGEGYRSILKKK